MSDQTLNVLLQLFYKELGVKTVFKIWWCFHLLYLLSVYVFSNLFIFLDSTKHLGDIHTVKLQVNKIIFKKYFIYFVSRIFSVASKIKFNQQQIKLKLKLSVRDVNNVKMLLHSTGMLRIIQTLSSSEAPE